jgi:hypothetical protein
MTFFHKTNQHAYLYSRKRELLKIFGVSTEPNAVIIQARMFYWAFNILYHKIGF